MQDKPEVAPSDGAILPKLSSIMASLRQIKKDRNLWLFFAAYCVCYGTLIAVGVNLNFIFLVLSFLSLSLGPQKFRSDADTMRTFCGHRFCAWILMLAV